MARTKRDQARPEQGSQRLARCCVLAMLQGGHKCPTHGVNVGTEVYLQRTDEWVTNG